MKWFVSFIQRILGVSKTLRGWINAKLGRKQVPFRYRNVDDLPDDFEPFTVYVAGEDPHFWAAAMLCPCGCGDAIELNLLRDVRPRWTFELHADGSVSLMPSVWRTRGCRSHFFVRHGRIEWCRSEVHPRPGQIPQH